MNDLVPDMSTNINDDAARAIILVVKNLRGGDLDDSSIVIIHQSFKRIIKDKLDKIVQVGSSNGVSARIVCHEHWTQIGEGFHLIRPRSEEVTCRPCDEELKIHIQAHISRKHNTGWVPKA